MISLFYLVVIWYFTREIVTCGNVGLHWKLLSKDLTAVTLKFCQRL